MVSRYLALGSKFPLDVIGVCGRSKAINKIGTTKTNDVYIDISETRFFKTVQMEMQTLRQD